MHIVMAKSKVTADAHYYDEGDIVIVRFEPDGNLQQQDYYEDDDSTTRRRRQKRSENWVWYAGEVSKVSTNGSIRVKFYDGDSRTLSGSELVTEVKRTSRKRLDKMFDDDGFAGIISNAQAYELAKTALKPRPLTKVINVDEESFEKEMAVPVSKMSPDAVEAASTWVWPGSWVNAPIYDAHNVKHVLPSCLIGLGLVRGKHCVILRADVESVEGGSFKTPWTVMEVYDRDPQITFDKLDDLVSRAKSKVKHERSSLTDLIRMRKEAKKSKRFK